MFAKVLIFTFVTSYVTAEIPSYIHICGRRDPNLDECITNNVDNLKGKICKGIPELDVPSNDPMHLPNLVVSETKDLQIYLKNTEIYGFCDFNVTSFHMDIDKLDFNTTVLFNNIRLTSMYDVNLYILMVSIVSKGRVILTTDNVNADVHVQMKKITKRDKSYVYVSNMILNLDIKDFTFEYEADDISEQMKEILTNMLQNYKKELIAIVKPAIEEVVSKTVISVSNSIVKHFTYEEFFPDRT